MLTASPWQDELFRTPLCTPTLRLVDARGAADVVPLPVSRWHGRPGPEEIAVLGRARGPVLDVGCGPGRHVRALIERSVPALGVDISPAAVRAARRRGAPAARASVFEDVPGSGGWMTVLLLDGNIGIGGDPTLLLRRCVQLLDPRGMVLAELDRPGVRPGRFRAWVEHETGVSPGFDWARLGPGQIRALAADCGLDTTEVWEAGGRWFVQLDR